MNELEAKRVPVYLWPCKNNFSPSMSAVDIIKHDPLNAETPASALVFQTTPIANAYIRTNFNVPDLSENHVIEIGGAVDHPLTLTLEALRKMEQQSIRATMECAGNDLLGMRPLPVGEPWKTGAVSTVEWTGVSLAKLLAMAGVADNAVEVLFTAEDSGFREEVPDSVRFARSLPIEVALQKETLLAIAMNGSALTKEHGFPVRLAVPGWYGMASVKWISRIDVLTEPFNGYFQQKRYVYDDKNGITPVDRIRVKSIITIPAEGSRVSKRSLQISGWAWSGYGPIARVEVGIDGGDTWQEAKLGMSSSSYEWTPWSITITLPHAGRFALKSRATDATGAVQPDQIVWNRLGYGNNAIRYILVDVDEEEGK